MIDEIQLEAEEHMTSSVEHTREQLVTIRTGRANPSMFNGLVAEYYGVPTPITQMATVSVPEPRMLLIKPYEQSMIGEIENAIRNSDLGVNPTNDGQVLRVIMKLSLPNKLTSDDKPPTGVDVTVEHGRRRQEMRQQRRRELGGWSRSEQASA